MKQLLPRLFPVLILFLSVLACYGYCNLQTVKADEADYFTIAVIPDTQNYSKNYPDIFDIQTRWIADNVDAENIVFVAHLGDIVDDYDYEFEWQNAQQSMSIIRNTGVPYSVVPGNHDIGDNGDLTYFDTYFPYTDFIDYPWYGGHYPDTSNSSNYELFSVMEQGFIILNLVCEPSLLADTVSWANDILTQYSDLNAIVITHGYIDAGGNYSDNGDVSGIEIWNKIVRLHSNVVAVLCGHSYGEYCNTVTGANGNTVYNLLTNYQGEARGGNGWLRLYKFYPQLNKIKAITYSPYLDRYDSSAYGEFELYMDMGGIPAGVEITSEIPDVIIPDSDFIVNLNVSDIINFNVADYTITFDPGVIDLTSITSGTIGTTEIPVEYNRIAADTVIVVNNLNKPATGVSGDGTLSVLHFHAVGNIGESCTITLSSGTLADNRAVEIPASWGSNAVTIEKIPAVIVMDDLIQVYDGTPKTVRVTTDPDVFVSITYNGAFEAPVDAGNYEVIATVIDDTYGGSAGGTLVINKADQTIIFNPVCDKGYASPDFTAEAVSSSGLPVIFTAEGSCTIEGNIVHITGEGNCVITAYQAGNGNYNPAIAVSQTFSVLMIAGDANGDGNINSQDITATIRIVLGLSPVTPTADANDDGEVDSLDIALIEWAILNNTL